MRVLGLDVSTKVGAVVVEQDREGGPIEPRAYELLQAKKAGGMDRARMLAGKAAQVAVRWRVDFAVIEGYGYANQHSLATLVEVGTLVRDRLWKNGFYYVVVAPTLLKKFVLGRGVGKKDQVMLGAYKRWGFEHESNDVVDAFVLARVGMAWAGKEAALTKAQREVLAKLPDVPQLWRRTDG